MTARQLQNDKGFDFSKRGKVSIWASNTPYGDIPDAYFDERFSKNNSRASNSWSDNFRIRFFHPESMETNGAQDGLIEIEVAAGQCSFSKSYINNLFSKATKLNLTKVSWVILLFEYEYSARLTGVDKDEYLTFIGAFNYDDEAENVYEIEEPA